MANMISFVLKKDGAMGELYLAQTGSPLTVNPSLATSLFN